MAKTILKKEDWGGLTIIALLAAYAFPPYFIYLMTMAALTEFAHLWTTKLSREDRDRFIAFEIEFRKGYKLQKEGKTEQAIKWYRHLENKYADLPQGAKLATLQIRHLTGKPSSASKTASKPKKKGR
ncbi:MAG TPA: hypothetical protein VK791_07570 [bacterium]|jgi:hypothetical protein|nr:hypothetical protein [bacterium]